MSVNGGALIRARLVVEGNVQGVGYRAFVKYVARKLKIKGLVRNLDDGTVEIFCETKQQMLDEFKKIINKKTKSKDIFVADVENINTFFEGSGGYNNPPRLFGTFDVDYGKEAKSPFEKSTLEKFEIGTLVMAGFREETSQNFTQMAEKYHSISEKLSGVSENFNALVRLLAIYLSKQPKYKKEIDAFLKTSAKRERVR